MMFSRLVSTSSLLFLYMITGSLFAQDISLELSPESELRIEGTSNVRDWGADASVIKADLVLQEFNAGDLDELRPEHFKSLEIRIPVEDLYTDSGRLRRNIHNYLESDSHPVITFALISVNDVSVNGNSAVIDADGLVTAAGESQQINMQVDAERIENELVFTGEHDMQMTDFDIDPPTAVLGTIRAHDEITIVFNLRFTG